MIILKEEFKLFVRKKPELIKYVNSGDTTWQKLYEQWSLYGEDENIWNKYKNNIKEENKTSKDETFSLSSLTDMIKKIDMEQVQKGVNSLQKIVELVQGFSVKDVKTNDNIYKPRQLFKKFED